MTPYEHFAFPNLYLTNGYTEIQTENGIERRYQHEDALEQCIRRIVLRKPRRLRGWDLRFLRRGLGLTQADFGSLVERDSQTVARWEKSPDEIPKFVDLIIRIRFVERFERNMSCTELLSYVDGTARTLPEKILLKLRGTEWVYLLEPKFELNLVSNGNSFVEISPESASIVKLYRQLLKGTSTVRPMGQQEPYAEVEGENSTVQWSGYSQTLTSSICLH
jgi:DNA-binding transcriptional regulator YiaG